MNGRVVGILLLALFWPLQPIDDAARSWVLAHRGPSLDGPMRVVSDRSRAALIALAAGGLVTVVGRAVVLETAVVLVPVNLVVEGLKWSIGRTRPDGDSRRKNSAFPSSHVANAFAVASVITRRWRRMGVPILVLATLVAYSRMYLDRHWLTDVSAGALIGVGGAFLGVWLVGWWRDARSKTTSV